jgi:predicted RNase H-like HicB family nuclease
MKYPVVLEPTPTGYSAYVVEMDGCIATGATLEEIRENIAGAIEVHMGCMREDGDLIPEPSIVEYVDICVPAYAALLRPGAIERNDDPTIRG